MTEVTAQWGDGGEAGNRKGFLSEQQPKLIQSQKPCESELCQSSLTCIASRDFTADLILSTTHTYTARAISQLGGVPHWPGL